MTHQRRKETIVTDDDLRNEFLVQLTAIAETLREGTAEFADFQSRRESEEVPEDLAMPLLEFQCIEELIGQRSTDDGTRVRFVTVLRQPTRPGGSGSLDVPVMPDHAARLEVYTGPGTPDEIDLTAGPDVGTHGYSIPGIADTTPITRLVFVRDDGYPLALGPQLPATA
jgi:hypothetical protein